MAGESVSGRALAAALGVSEAAVRKAEKSGRIKKGAGGLYDIEECRRAWGKSTDPARTKVREPANRGAQATVRTPQDAEAAVALIARVLKGEGAIDVGAIDYGMARTADTILKAYERDLKIAQRRKELVPAIQTAQHFAKSFTGYKQAMQRIPSRHASEMAAVLGCDASLLDELMSKAIAAELNELSAPMVRA